MTHLHLLFVGGHLGEEGFQREGWHLGNLPFQIVPEMMVHSTGKIYLGENNFFVGIARFLYKF